MSLLALICPICLVVLVVVAAMPLNFSFLRPYSKSTVLRGRQTGLNMVQSVRALYHRFRFDHRTPKLSKKDIDHFDREGYVLVRGLLTGKILEAAIADANSSLETPSAFGESAYKKIQFNDLQTSKGLRRAAFASGSVVCQLMEGERDLRVLKDAMLAFQPRSTGCGWHVDDVAFWPCPLSTPGSLRGRSASAGLGNEGVNVWIALSPYKKSHGGGLAIAPSSHKGDVT
jgi:hypothetical protein